jgi:2-haloacid dehalogenase
MCFDAVVFDFGGVLFDWNPHYLYRGLIPDDVERERFLADVCTSQWNMQQDAGRPISQALAEKVAEFPHLEHLIRPYYERWAETLAGTLAEGIALLDELHGADVPLYGLTNWSAETFPLAEARFPHIMSRFRDIVVSGRERMAKPDERIYHLLIERIGHRPERCVFIDDSAANIATAGRLGFHAIYHTNAALTRERLRELGAPISESVSKP